MLFDNLSTKLNNLKTKLYNVEPKLFNNKPKLYNIEALASFVSTLFDKFRTNLFHL
mgnify:CR=1 FL=1